MTKQDREKGKTLITRQRGRHRKPGLPRVTPMWVTNTLRNLAERRERRDRMVLA